MVKMIKFPRLSLKIPKSRRARIVVIVLLSLFFVFGFLILKNAFGATRTWDGGGDGISCPGEEYSWSCDENWSTDTIPGASDTALFDGTSDKVATVDASFAGSVAGVDVNSGYDGTITQATSLTVGSSNFDQDGGTWDGGAEILDINDGDFTVSGGAHTGTTGTWTIERSLIYSGGTLDVSGSTISFDDSSNADDSTITCTGSFSPASLVLVKTSDGGF